MKEFVEKLQVELRFPQNFDEDGNPIAFYHSMNDCYTRVTRLKTKGGKVYYKATIFCSDEDLETFPDKTGIIAENTFETDEDLEDVYLWAMLTTNLPHKGGKGVLAC